MFTRIFSIVCIAFLSSSLATGCGGCNEAGQSDVPDVGAFVDATPDMTPDTEPDALPDVVEEDISDVPEYEEDPCLKDGVLPSIESVALATPIIYLDNATDKSGILDATIQTRCFTLPIREAVVFVESPRYEISDVFQAGEDENHLMMQISVGEWLNELVPGTYSLGVTIYGSQETLTKVDVAELVVE